MNFSDIFFAVPLDAWLFHRYSSMGQLGGLDPDIPLTDEILYPVLQDSTLEWLSVVLEKFSSLRMLMTDVKILDLN